MTFTHDQLQQAVQTHYPTAKVTWSKPLTGGISATVIALEVVFPDTRPQWWVLRAYGESDYKPNPNIAYDEYRLLKVLRKHLIPVPEPRGYEVSTELLGAPYLLQSYIHGVTPDLSITMVRIKFFVFTWRFLPRLHKIDLTENDLSFLPIQDAIIQKQLKTPPSQPNRVFDALEEAYPLISVNSDSLLHGDFWHGNVLWDDGLVGIIDWEDAMIGDPLSDIGKLRLELYWSTGYDYFREKNMSPLDTTYLPFWDLWGAWRLRDFASWFDDTEKVQRMQAQYDEFVDNAIQGCKQFAP